MCVQVQLGIRVFTGVAEPIIIRIVLNSVGEGRHKLTQKNIKSNQNKYNVALETYSVLAAGLAVVQGSGKNANTKFSWPHFV